jgi:hypothetical protein
LKQRIFGIILLITLLTPVFFSAAWLHYKKKAVKREIKWRIIAGLERDELICLRFSLHDAEALLRWEHPGEFEYRGEMYDVVEQISTTDSVVFWCWWDHAETRLNRQLKNLVDYALGKDAQKQENGKRFYMFLSSLYLSSTSDFDVISQPVFQIRFSELGFCLCAFNIQPPSPPPRLG